MIKLISLKKTCIGCPSVWEGITDKNEEFYARFRWGKLKMWINDELRYELKLKNKDEHDGIMDTDEMVKILNLDVNEELIKNNLTDWKKILERKKYEVFDSMIEEMDKYRNSPEGKKQIEENTKEYAKQFVDVRDIALGDKNVYIIPTEDN